MSPSPSRSAASTQVADCGVELILWTVNPTLPTSFSLFSYQAIFLSPDEQNEKYFGVNGVGVSAAETNQQTIEYTAPATPGVESEVRTTTITPGGPFFVFEAVVGSVSLLTIPLSPSNISIQLLNSPTYTGDVPTLGHYGNVSNQTATGPAVIDLELYNCFSFGNGVESFKINDGFATPGFRIGARTTAVSLEDYKEVNRYFDITYSGVYNQQTNINKLNEFNLFIYYKLQFAPMNNFLWNLVPGFPKGMGTFQADDIVSAINNFKKDWIDFKSTTIYEMKTNLLKQFTYKIRI